MVHTGNIQDKSQEERDTLFMAEHYMDCLGEEFEELRKQKVSDVEVKNILKFCYLWKKMLQSFKLKISYDFVRI